AVIQPGKTPARSRLRPAADEQCIARLRAGADPAGLPFGTIAVDGAHIYEPTEEARAVNRANAYRWIDVAKKLGATQVRIDAGGPEQLPDEAFAPIVEGYEDTIGRAGEHGIEVLLGTPCGPTKIPVDGERLRAA